MLPSWDDCWRTYKKIWRRDYRFSKIMQLTSSSEAIIENLTTVTTNVAADPAFLSWGMPRTFIGASWEVRVCSPGWSGFSSDQEGITSFARSGASIVDSFKIHSLCAIGSYGRFLYKVYCALFRRTFSSFLELGSSQVLDSIKICKKCIECTFYIFLCIRDQINM